MKIQFHRIDTNVVVGLLVREFCCSGTDVSAKVLAMYADTRTPSMEPQWLAAGLSQVFYAMPFLLTRIGTYMGGVLALDAYIPYGRELLADSGWGICLTRNLAAYAVFGFLYYREMKWRRING